MNPFPTINCLAFVAYSGARIVDGAWYVTGQPSTPAYAAIAAAGIKAVVCVRQPGEPVAPPPVPPPPPFDTGEAAALAALHVSYTNIPITRTMTQAQFNIAATQAAIAYLNAIAQGPGLIHCSTGDRENRGRAIAFGEKVHGADGTVDLRAVANRRGHVQNALVIGDRIEAALGGIAEIANDDHASRSDQTVQKTATSAPALAARANGHQGRVRATTALTAIAVPASGARM